MSPDSGVRFGRVFFAGLRWPRFRRPRWIGGHGGFGHGHFAGHFGHGGFGHHHGFRGFGFYPGFAFYGGPYYDDYYYDDYDDYNYCFWRHGRRLCRY